ncbi:hypothetical protein DV113_002553 [Geotrichum candidum]|uniref:Similar to Saccharomyces cerevisiae YDR428C BNA7 Formylkynurenine formamidase, involved in the de novo biosynthesis of NAD from tryptophan via kynurenine n=1 Tax=Geotrichum candidum TaxID=1173061 RepID=A0A0J9X963_GEOCN|nr:hypothetical protein DV454_000152 [Geotrichum candidum]KAI9212218.1 hypothetical protein DS838_002920 [Geotrichum bryndzae]KAF5121629.1 hypothetical protein DV452_000699 [Geotrichum candidum]KAF7499426.1 hypothetical protein DV113_002553 [Geotrichum candidum]KAI8134783.1 hypothetical protein DUD61_001568 [Geotrichum candidum]
MPLIVNSGASIASSSINNNNNNSYGLADDQHSYVSSEFGQLGGLPRTKRPAPITIPYQPSPNPFHTLDLYLPAGGLSKTTPWLIFLHGGYWQDASQSKEVGASVLTRLPPHWAGASIDYRLSPEISHPGHLTDVNAAVRFLRSAYQIQSAVIMAHGAGACIAFQFLSTQLSLVEDDSACWIKHVVGSGGVYDLVDLARDSPYYRSFITDAYGDDPEHWFEFSPMQSEWRALYTPNLKVTLVHSKYDSIVPLGQALKFNDILVTAGFPVSLRIVNIDGHDDVLDTSDLPSIAREVCEEMDRQEVEHTPQLPMC